MKSESKMGNAGAQRDYLSTRPLQEILAKARTRMISFKEITGLGPGYAMFSEVIDTARLILPDQALISNWGAEAMLRLMTPVVTPNADGRFELAWGLRSLASALAHSDIHKFPMRLVEDMTRAEMDELAFVDIYLLPFQIALRPDASGVGRLFTAFSARSETVPKPLLKKVFPRITSLRKLESATRIYVPSGRKRASGQIPQASPEVEPGASNHANEEPTFDESQAGKGANNE